MALDLRADPSGRFGGEERVRGGGGEGSGRQFKHDGAQLLSRKCSLWFMVGVDPYIKW